MGAGNSGLFYAPNLVAKNRSASPAFCKPINVRVYSAPPPVRMRVVTYEMVYWDGKAQPNVKTQWSELTRYQSPKGHCNFSFTIGTAPKTLDDLLNEIRRHFYAVVQNGKQCRSRDEGIDRLLGMNTSEQYVNSTAPRVAHYRVFDVHHIEIVRLNTDLDHFVASRKLRYHAEVRDSDNRYLMDDRYVSASMEYDDNRELAKAALKHLQCEETLTLLKSVDNQTMV